MSARRWKTEGLTFWLNIKLVLGTSKPLQPALFFVNICAADNVRLGKIEVKAIQLEGLRGEKEREKEMTF